MPATARIMPPDVLPARYAPGSAEDMLLGAAIERATWEEYNIRTEADRRFGANLRPTVLSASATMNWAVMDEMPYANLMYSNAATVPATTFRVETTAGTWIGTGTYEHNNPQWVRQNEWVQNTMASNTFIRAADFQFNIAINVEQMTRAFEQIQFAAGDLATTLGGDWAAIPVKNADKPRKRARRLLMSHLTDYQRRMYRKHRYFHVVSEKGKKYRIKHGDTQNVYLLEKGKEAKRFCIHPSNVPVEDAMLAQLLMLETDEHAFLKIANAFPVPAYQANYVPIFTNTVAA